MSLFDRLTEARSSTTFTSMKGSDSFTHTDRWKNGRRNKTPKGSFVFGKWKRYPVAHSRASAAGSLRQAYKRGVGKKVAAVVKSRRNLNLCPAVMKGCKDRRGKHGKGGPPEQKTSCQGKHCGVQSTSPDHGRKKSWPWKFNVGKKPDWAKSDWSKPSKKKKPQKKSPNKKN